METKKQDLKIHYKTGETQKTTDILLEQTVSYSNKPLTFDDSKTYTYALLEQIYDFWYH